MVSALDFRARGLGSSPLDSRRASVYSGVQIGIGEVNAKGNPAMD